MRHFLVVAGTLAVMAGGAQPTATLAQEQNCSPAYPDVCIPPPPPDLDCRDLDVSDFAAAERDPHEFDPDGDGVGCEGGVSLPPEKSLAPLFVAVLAAASMVVFVFVLGQRSRALQRLVAEPETSASETEPGPLRTLRRVVAEELRKGRRFEIWFGVVMAVVGAVVGTLLSIWLSSGE